MNKAHIEHAIGFIQHQDFDLREINRILMRQIQQTTWRCHQHVNAAAQFHHLRINADATKHDQ